MKILYCQNSKIQLKNTQYLLFGDWGVKNLYFKSIAQCEQDGSSTKKRHSHTGYEFHMIVGGKQTYETEDGCFSVEGGNFLAIPKGKAHRLVFAEYPIKKYAATFSFDECAEEIWEGLDGQACKCLPIPERVWENIRAVSDYTASTSATAPLLLEHCIFETVILLLRAVGIEEKGSKPPESSNKSGDGRVELARQFISDNIESPLQVSEVAAYCYLSEKQLTRLFYSSEKLSPAAYIRRERMRHVEELLRDPTVTLCEISRRMGFPNESGFNAFFKKNNGMPPGEYRKMITNGKG